MHGIPGNPCLCDDIGQILFYIVKLKLHIFGIQDYSTKQEILLSPGMSLTLQQSVNQCSNHPVNLILVLPTDTRIDIGLGNGRQIVPQGMAPYQGRFPSLVSLCTPGIQTCCLTETGKQSVCIKRHQISQILIQCVNAVGIQIYHIFHGKFGNIMKHILHLILPPNNFPIVLTNRNLL